MTEQWDNFEKPTDKSREDQDRGDRNDGGFGQREQERQSEIEERRDQQRRGWG